MDAKQIIHVWITRHALTQGIFEVDAEICTASSTEMIATIPRPSAYYHGKGKDWHETFESAKSRAEIMREQQIKTLEKRVLKLRKMKF